MKNLLTLLTVIGFIAINSCNDASKLNYPQTEKVEVIDNYFGVDVVDPYRWLEDDNSAETAEWVKQQNDVTFGYLNSISFREKINERLTDIWDYPKYGVPWRAGKNYFFFKNDGMQNQSVLYIQEGLEAEPRVFLDPNTFSLDGTVSLTSIRASNDDRYLAYGISKAGSDWNEIKVMDIETGEHLNDHLEWIKFSGISWKGNGFYYSRYDAPEPDVVLSGKNEFHKVYYHTLGSLQSQDELIYQSFQFPLRNYRASATEDERFLLLYESETTSGNALYVKDLAIRNSPFVQLVEGFDKDYSVLDNIVDQLLVLTNFNAPRKQLVLMNPANPTPEAWQVIIPEKNEVLQSARLLGGHIAVQYMKDATSRAYLHNLQGEFVQEVNLPGIGTLAGFSGKKEDNIAFYAFTSFVYPSAVFKYDISKNGSEIYRTSDIDFDPNAYETKQIFYTSKDGTQVPMFITHKKGIKMNGKNPTLLYGYGGFNASMTPSFSVSRLILLENGGVYALANLRGGGEYGEAWHKAGTKLLKQNVFDDFIAAAEYLIEQKYTSPSKLAIQGGSNGGLLVGAVVNQRPDLFKVALPAVGVMDMLRFHKFTIGWAWVGDYGSSEKEEEFHYLMGYSPYHNLKDGVEYPATLITTADHDDRVVPAHSFKYAARLQEAHKGKNPVLIRIETSAGHGAGKPTAKIIEEQTDLWTFVFKNLGVKPIY
ncbi:MAG: prolyl oligopeptidase family serine peptidase [Bacteroidales bacterium]|nr:prolyl oligopeptidase family serine peptidase [Bacteroidales bacterium]MDZ4203430.1 prolyl oligopeptidase family serine peptidase [Bacteroidales bacterium]